MFRNRLFLLCSVFSVFLTFVFLTSRVRTTYGVDTVVATLVNTVHTSTWSPPSPDPAGITYNPFTNTLVVVDSEVDEMPIFEGKNVYETTLDGTLVSTADTMDFTPEPTDIAFNPTNGHYFFSNDGMKRVYEVDLGPDGVVGTSDDVITFISASAFGSIDTEGVGYGDGKLFVADGAGQTIYVVNPGVNGLFDGIAPTGDDQVTSFDVASFGVSDPEGVAYNSDSGTLFVVDYKKTTGKTAIEVTTDGQLVRKIDISQANPLHPAGVTYAPASYDPNKKSLYIVDRGIDNDSDKTENDGKIYEMLLPSSDPTNTPTPTDIPTPTPTPDPNEPTATSTPTTEPTTTPTVTPTPSGEQTVLTFTATDDAGISQGAPNKNFGEEPTVVGKVDPVKDFLLKFTVTDVNNRQVAGAKLLLYTINPSNTGGSYYSAVNNDWNEGTLTWNNAPSVAGGLLGSLGQVAKNTWYEIDLTSVVVGDGTYSFRASSFSYDAAAFASSENQVVFQPQLVVALSE